MSENSKKAARVNSLKKKLQVRRAATGGPKGDFYIIGGAVKDEYDGLFVMERYHGKSIVVCLGPKSRGVFLQKVETILPETRNMTNADCLALLMGDDPPQEIENLLYRFLTSLFRRRLGILAAQGEGL